MYRRTYAEINLDHIVHNFEVLKNAFPPDTFLCPMVKANAYGHGDVAVALCLEKAGAKHLGVCLLEEGLKLRQAGVAADILVFRGFERQEAQEMIRHRLTPVVSSWRQLELIEAEAAKAVQVHLKFNTGMNRLGFQPAEAQALFERCWQNPKLRVQGLLTHLYNGEDAMSPEGHSAAQLALLEKVSEIFKPLQPQVHCLNSAGLLNHLAHPLSARRWGLRPGIAIYGYPSVPPPQGLVFKPAMTLRSHTSTYRELNAGEVVSYGGTWKAARPSVIAVVPMGYADGYHRILSNRAEALFAGHRVPVVGTVCMDFLMLDITTVVQGRPLGELGEQEVVLFGYGSGGSFLSAQDLAAQAQTISYEILTSVSARVPRVYVGEWARKIGVGT